MGRLDITDDTLLTMEETAKMIGISRQTLSSMARRGEIQAVKAGRQNFFTGLSIRRWAGLAAPAD